MSSALSNVWFSFDQGRSGVLGSGADPTQLQATNHLKTIREHSILPPKVTKQNVLEQNKKASSSQADLFLLKKYSRQALIEATNSLSAIEIQATHSAEMMKIEDKLQLIRSKHGKAVARHDLQKQLTLDSFDVYTQTLREANGVVDASFT